jgi:mRNA interferase RelE/StbE
VAGKKFAVVVTRPALKDLGNLDRQIVKTKIEPVLLALEDNPRPFDSSALTDPQKGYHRIRRGDYRIVYLIDYESSRIYVTKVSHRSDVYRK